MKEKKIIKRKVVSIIISATALSLTMSIQAAPLTIGEDSSVVASDQQTSTLDYWTREMIATTPVTEMPMDIGTGEIDVFAQDEVAFTESPGSVPAGKAERGSNRFHREVYPEDWDALNNEDWGAQYSDYLGLELDVKDDDEATLNESLTVNISSEQMADAKHVFIDYPVNEKKKLWKIYPHKWMGKFTYTASSGNFSCSATTINNNHIVTAAHCVFDTFSRNEWHTNKAFTPTYRNGQTPYGTFPTIGCRILPAWVALSGSYTIDSWARHDIAVCRMGKNSAGKTLNQAVGWSGYGWNWDYKQLHFNTGYPAFDFNDIELPSPAQYLRSCTAVSFKQTTDTLGMGCQYGRGISGGASIRGYMPNYVSGWINSVNSGLFIGQAKIYGVRFTTGNIKTLCNANGC